MTTVVDSYTNPTSRQGCVCVLRDGRSTMSAHCLSTTPMSFSAETTRTRAKLGPAAAQRSVLVREYL